MNGLLGHNPHDPQAPMPPEAPHAEPQAEPQAEGQGTLTAASFPDDAGVEVSDQARPYMAKAVEILYRDNFETLIRMFETNGPERFPEAMSGAINATLTRLRQEQAPQEILAEVGVSLFGVLITDLLQHGTLQELSGDQVTAAIQRTLNDYLQAHPEEYDEQEVQAALQQMNEVPL